MSAAQIPDSLPKLSDVELRQVYYALDSAFRDGIRAALIHDHFSAKQGVENDHMNILCMGVRTVGPESGSGLGEDLHRGGLQLRTWYLRRLGKVTEVEVGKL